MSVDVSALPCPAASAGAVWRCVETDGRKEAVVDVPGMGFAWVGAGAKNAVPPKPTIWTRRRRKIEPPPLAEPYVLRNEYFEVTIDPTTGAIRSICLYNTRGNRLAQQLAMRIPSPSRPKNAWEEEDNEQDYSIMVADRVTVSEGPLVGRIESRGRLVDRRGQLIARFVQNMSVRRGSRVLQLDIELDVDRQPEPKPWDSYYAVRFAWGTAVTEVRRSVHGTSHASQGSSLEAPQFIDLRSANTSTTILTGGLPYHRRFGARKLDTLLIVHGETARHFQLGIGVDLMYPVPAAVDFAAPPVAVLVDRPPSGDVGWLFHLDAKNVVATDWQPLVSGGAVVGYRARLLETEGRVAEVGLRSFRALASACRPQLNGQNPTVLPVHDDCVTIRMMPYEWVSMEARFTSP
jgi:alpha-mannosidase